MDNFEDQGNWIRHKILGSGAFGVVELWKNDQTGNVIALKNIKGGISQLTKKQKERWIKEVETMNSLSHANIVGTRNVPSQLQNLGEGLPLLCMEFCSRGDLRTVLNQTENCCGIEEREALKIMGHISSAVQYLHSKSLVHRDLKPENIVLQGTKEKTIYKLTDLGYVRELGDESVDGSVVGTCNYLAPELLWKPRYTNSVDYWSLGILFYEIVTGNRPFLPNMPITQTWMRHIQAKRYEHICARGTANNVVFSDQIESPSTISDCMREHLTPWFRIALQWDPSRRGKLPVNPENPDDLVIFSNLYRILKWKIAYVFVVPLYRIDSFAVYPNISVHDMQNLIREKTGIENADQIITDRYGNVINQTDDLLFNCIESPHLMVFQRDKLRVEKVPMPNMSPPVRQIFENPRDMLDYETTRRNSAATVYFIKQELELFTSYIIALSIKIDLSNTNLESLRESVQALKTSANSLMNQLIREAQSQEFGIISAELKGNFETTIARTQDLLTGADGISANLDVLSNGIEVLKSFSESNWLKNWTQLHEKATSVYETSLKRNPGQRDSPAKMVQQLIYPALKLHGEQLTTPEIESFISEINIFDTNILKLKMSLSSFEALVDSYRQILYGILTRRAAESTNAENMFISDFTDNDLRIIDNLILRHLLDGAIDAFETQVDDLAEMEFENGDEE